MADKEFRFELKTLAEDGSFEGFGSTYHNVDLQGDRILPGAFTKSLQENGNEVPLLWHHKDAIGVANLTDTPEGLMVSGKLVLAVEKAREAYALLKARAVRGLSIGYSGLKSRYASDGVRELLEVRLAEMSLTPVPANPLAAVTAVKSAEPDIREQQVKAFRAVLAECRKSFVV